MVLDHEFPTDIRVENEIEALISKGNEVHIACYTRESRINEDTYKGAFVHRRKISSLIYKSSVACLKFPMYFMFWRKFLQPIVERNNFDAIHIHDLPLAKVGYEFSKKYGLKFVLDLHENWPAMLRMATHTNTFFGRLLSSNIQWEKYELNYCKKASKIIVVVKEAKARLIGLGIEKDTIVVVSNTLNFDHFEMPKSEPNNDFITLMYAGGINKHRGLQYVIEGIKLLSDLPKPVRCWIIGTGSYIEELKKIALSHGVEKQVSFEGWKNYEEMQKYMGMADICLIPHIKSDHTDSTIPHKIFQYMYAGKPIVASNCIPIERIINETNSGLIYPFDDAIKFAQCVKQIIENPASYKQMQKNGIAAVRDTYNWLIDSEILNAVYAE